MERLRVGSSGMISFFRGIAHHPIGRRLLALPLALRRRYVERNAAKTEHMVSRMAERLVGEVQLRVPEFGGEFVIGSRSDLFRRILRHGDYEPKVRELFLSAVLPDRDVIDVGANIGFFTVLAAGRLTTGRVLSAEPGSVVFHKLSTNVTCNRVRERVLLFNGLVSSANGEGIINTTVGKEEYSSSVRFAHPATAGLQVTSERVPMRTLDSLVQEHKLVPSILKIDVEGAEAQVLEGARNVLLEYRPKIICEYSKVMLGDAASAVLRLLAECNYKVVDPEVPSLPPGTRDPCDLWCVPL